MSKFVSYAPAIALIVAIITPAITTYLSNRHQYKMFILEKKHDDAVLRYNKQAEVYQAFISAVRLTMYELTVDRMKDFDEIYLYTPEHLWSKIDEINISLRTSKQTDIIEDLLISFNKDLSVLLSQSIPKLL